MALPEGIETCTVTSGVPVTFGGAPVKAFVSVEPSVYLVHTATGTPLVDFLEELSVTEGVAAQFTLPVDQDGFQDENGNAYRGWFYTARITYSTTSKAKNKTPKVKVFQLVTGQTLVDLDTLPGGVAALPYTAPLAAVTSVNGQTGAVTVAPEPLPARLEEAALNATFGPAAAPMLATFATPADAGAVLNRRALMPWYAAVAGRDTTSAKWLAWGDSWTAGAQAVAWDNTYGRVAQKRLNARYPATSNPVGGYYMPWIVGSGSSPAVPVTTTGSVGGSGGLFGPGFNNLSMLAGTAASATMTVTGTSAKIWFGRGGSVSQVNVSIDGGADTLYSIPARPTLATADGYLLPVTLGAAGSHTIKVSWVSGLIYTAGIDVFNGDENAGIHLIAGGHGGFQSSDYLTNDNGGVGPTSLSQVSATVAPQLISLMLGVNDWGKGTQTAAQFKTNMRTLITRLRLGAPDAAFLLVAEPLTAVQAGTPGPYIDFVNKLYEIAREDTTIALLDLNARMPSAAIVPAPFGLYASDQIHPSPKGYAMIGDALVAALSPA